VREIKAESWTQLHELLYEGSWNEELGLFRSNLAYRGWADATERSLMLLGGDSAALEGHLVNQYALFSLTSSPSLALDD
jgi:hypothetical protein